MVSLVIGSQKAILWLGQLLILQEELVGGKKGLTLQEHLFSLWRQHGISCGQEVSSSGTSCHEPLHHFFSCFSDPSSY